MSALSALLICFYIQYRYLSARPVRLPQELPVIQSNATDFENIVKQTQLKRLNGPIVMKNKVSTYVHFPSQCHDEIRQLPEETASFPSFFHTSKYGESAKIGRDTPAVVNSILKDVTRYVPDRVAIRQQDCKNAFDLTIGNNTDWKPFKGAETVFAAFAQFVGSSFVGRELATSSAYAKCINAIIAHQIADIAMINSLPLLLRPLLAPLLLLPLKIHQWSLQRMLTPYVKEDIKEFRQSRDRTELLKPKTKGKIPLTAMLLSRYTKKDATIDQLTQDHLILALKSVESTGALVWHSLCELCQHPEAVPLLRTELEEVMVDGQLPSTHLHELKLMDSCLRETLRLHPMHTFTLLRQIRTSVQLSVGPIIPVGAVINVGSMPINRSHELWDDPDKFDVARFHKLRQQPGKDNKFRLTSTELDSPNWGGGTQACPGRFFAANSAKIALAHILLHYDVKLATGTKYPIVDTPWIDGGMKLNTEVEFCFRSRQLEGNEVDARNDMSE